MAGANSGRTSANSIRTSPDFTFTTPATRQELRSFTSMSPRAGLARPT